ncbi:hypothetical protein AVEN_108620-1 [Araneus ventricosus]|uniref:DDE-1 domain-containing protein n=1 Tax=Araneus ventricosus TaxID=182803 RepID=A0A4Y2DGX7_ARAVE|nr:hypothetical protein AVEN_108620-1 [Araneus ventricosus]
MDETGISTVPNTTPKVITPKVKKTVGKISSAERGQTVTPVCCMSATGVFVPPASILPRKRMNPLLYKDAPNGTLPLISDIGYMNSHLYIDWLKHFVKHAKLSTEDPVLLIADNHISCCSLPAVLLRESYNVSYSSNTAHVLQPLDKCFFVPLKALYSSEAEKWLVENPGKVIALYEIQGFFKKLIVPQPGFNSKKKFSELQVLSHTTLTL